MYKRTVSQAELLNTFNDFFSERGYRVLTHNDGFMGQGSVVCKDDVFVPVLSLHIWPGNVAENFVSIHIKDRNGNAVLEGATAGIYSMVDTGDREKNALVFSKMINDAYCKYGEYSKTNRLDLVFNEITQERKTYDGKALSVDDLIANAENQKTTFNNAITNKNQELGV